MLSRCLQDIEIFLSVVRREDFAAAVRMCSVVFWVETPCGLVNGYHRSQERIASVFRAEFSKSVIYERKSIPAGIRTELVVINAV
jgi:hypothetical protein